MLDTSPTPRVERRPMARACSRPTTAGTPSSAGPSSTCTPTPARCPPPRSANPRPTGAPTVRRIHAPLVRPQPRPSATPRHPRHRSAQVTPPSVADLHPEQPGHKRGHWFKPSIATRITAAQRPLWGPLSVSVQDTCGTGEQGPGTSNASEVPSHVIVNVSSERRSPVAIPQRDHGTTQWTNRPVRRRCDRGCSSQLPTPAAADSMEWLD